MQQTSQKPTATTIKAGSSEPVRRPNTCPSCHGEGRVISLGKYVSRMACSCGYKWSTHTTLGMMEAAEATRAAAIAAATGAA